MDGANKKNKRVLITGIAGFIGFHFAKKLLTEGYHVIGIDNINDYYDVNLKYSRLNQLGFSLKQIKASGITTPINSEAQPLLVFYHMDLKDRNALIRIFEQEKPVYVVHTAAQAGVRYSLQNPYAYIDSNIISFMNILENCRHHNIKHLVFSSSSLTDPAGTSFSATFGLMLLASRLAIKNQPQKNTPINKPGILNLSVETFIQAVCLNHFLLLS